MRIQHNMQSMNSNRVLGITNSQRSKVAEQLSSGYQVNRAADDAAGLSISEKMRKQIRGLDRGSDNVGDGISFCQVADGALSEVCDMLNRMKVLSIQSANGTNSDSDRRAIDNEIQQLKNETERIFQTTSFNEKLIWGKGRGIAQEMTRTTTFSPVRMSTGLGSYSITNENMKKWPQNGFKLESVEADEAAGTPAGLKFKWTAIDGENCESDLIPWPEPDTAGQTLVLADHLKHYTQNPEKYKGLNCIISYSTTKYTEFDEIKNTVTNGTFYTTVHKNSSAQVDGTNEVYPSFQISTEGIEYSNINLNGYADTSFASFASMTNIGSSATDDSNQLKFSFTFVDRLDPTQPVPNPLPTTTVTTQPTSVTMSKSIRDYNSADRVSSDDETAGRKTYHSTPDAYFSNDGWWGKYAEFKDGYFYKYTPISSSVSQSLSSFTAKSIADLLKGNVNNPELGGLLDNHNGAGDESVSITLNYDLVGNGKSYGSFSLTMTGKESDSVDSFLSKLRNITSADLYASSSGGNTDSQTSGTGSNNWVTYTTSGFYNAPYRSVDENYYEVVGLQDKHRDIHSAPDADMDVKLLFDYACLSNKTIGISDMNVLTTKTSLDAMGIIDEAARIVVGQRSLFGAYQNRLEHTVRNIDNVVENTTSAESRIRDTDMAEAMVRLSTQNILAQAGQSMLAQANQTTNGVMSLLQ